MPRTVDRANAEARRTAILRAAMRCFSEKGLHETSLADIGKACGMRPGHIHYYFPSKVTIIQAVNALSADELAGRIEAMFEAAPDLAGAILGLHAQVEDVRRDWEISPLLRLELTAETLRNPALRETAEQCNGRVARVLAETARRAVDDGKLGPGVDPEALARVAALIWNAMSLIRIWEGVDYGAYERVAEAMIGNWKLSGAGGASQNPAVGQAAVERPTETEAPRP